MKSTVKDEDCQDLVLDKVEAGSDCDDRQAEN